MKLSDFQLDPRNANKGTDRGRKALAASLKEYGAGRSILVDKKGRVIAGNKTLEQAIASGYKDILVVKTDGSKLVAVQRMDLDLKDKRAKALAIADNRVGELDLEWDAEVLAELGKDVDLSHFWSAKELEEMLGAGNGAEAPEPKLDQATALCKKWKVKTGQLWEISRHDGTGAKHRLLCGDSTQKADVGRLMQGKQPQMVLVDPPYGMNLDTDWSGTRGGKYKRVEGDGEPFDPAPIFQYFGKCAEMFLWGADYYAERIPEVHKGSWLVWDKRKPSQSEAIGSEFELCWSRAKHKRRILRHDWFGFLSSGNTAEARNRVHPTQKPSSLMIEIMEQWGEKGDLVVDSYSGSGTTLAAAEQCGRTCYGCELDPAYVAVTLERLSDMGLKPKLAS